MLRYDYLVNALVCVSLVRIGADIVQVLVWVSRPEQRVRAGAFFSRCANVRSMSVIKMFSRGAPETCLVIEAAPDAVSDAAPDAALETAPELIFPANRSFYYARPGLEPPVEKELIWDEAALGAALEAPPLPVFPVKRFYYARPGGLGSPIENELNWDEATIEKYKEASVDKKIVIDANGTCRIGLRHAVSFGADFADFDNLGIGRVLMATTGTVSRDNFCGVGPNMWGAVFDGEPDPKISHPLPNIVNTTTNRLDVEIALLSGSAHLHRLSAALSDQRIREHSLAARAADVDKFIDKMNTLKDDGMELLDFENKDVREA